MGEFLIRKMIKIVTFEKKNGPKSIPNASRIGPEPFRSNFHIIFALRDPKKHNFSMKFNKKVEK